MKVECAEPDCDTTVEYKDEDALIEDEKWEYYSTDEYYCPKHWRVGKPAEENIILDNYEKAKYRPRMTRLVITQPACTKDGMWEPELLWWENGGWAGHSSNNSFASIDACISWAKEELAQKQNYNKFGKPDTEIMVEIYKPIRYKRITIAYG